MKFIRFHFLAFILHYLWHLAIMIGSMSIAIQLRYDLRYGKTLGPKYEAQPPLLFLVLSFAVLAAALVVWLDHHYRFRHRLKIELSFKRLVLSAGIATDLTLVLLPEVSQLQMLYFLSGVGILGILLIVIPNRLRLAQNLETFATHIASLWRNRILIRVWLKYNVEARYTQSILGILWVLLLPLATASVLALAFTVFLRVKFDVPFIVFFFSPLIFYNIFSQGVGHSTRSILGSMTLINQVSFPREVLVLVALGEVLVDFLFGFVAMLVINALYGVWPNPLFILLIPIWLILVCFTLGLMFLISYMSVLIRDIPQLVSIVLQLLFYLTPLIYPAERIPAKYQLVVLINPLAPIVQSIRDIIVYDRLPDLLSLTYPLVVAVVLFYLGYTLFKANENRLADMV